MMSGVIRQETMVFLLSVLHGVTLAFGYDLLRAARRAFPHGLVAVSAEDFLFWLVAGFLTFVLTFLKTDGVIRGYVVVGIGLGVVLYHDTVSALVVKGISGLLTLLKRIWGLVWSFLSKPFKKIWRKWKKMIVFAQKKAYNKNKCRKEARQASAKDRKKRNHTGKMQKGAIWNGKRKKAREQK